MKDTAKKLQGWEGIIVGFTCGSFDILRTGHALMLKECKKHCNYLIVGLQSDPSIDRPGKNKPIQEFEEHVPGANEETWAHADGHHHDADVDVHTTLEEFPEAGTEFVWENAGIMNST